MKYLKITLIFLVALCYQIRANANSIQSDDVIIEVFNPCNAESYNGFIDVNILGGQGPYEIAYYRQSLSYPYFIPLYSSPTSGNNGKEDLDNLGPGSYFIVITDRNCGYYFQSVELDKGIIIDGEVEFECGKFTGLTIKPSVSGGIGPYSFNWSTGSTDNRISMPELNQFGWSVTVTDATGCTAKKSWEPKWPKRLLNATISVNDYGQSSNGRLCDGPTKLSANISGDYKSNINYIWNTGATTKSIYIDALGDYKVTLTSDDRCQNAEAQVKINGKYKNITINTRNPQECNCDGQIQFSNFYFPLTGVSNQASSITLENLNTGEIITEKDETYFTELCAGTYKWQSQREGCFSSGVINLIPEPCEKEIKPVNLKHNCICSDENCTGLIEIELINVPTIYSRFKWFKDGVYFTDTKNVFNLCPGVYKVEYHHNINEPPVTAEFIIYNDCNNFYSQNIDLKEIKNASGCETNDGVLEIGVNFNGALTYAWSNGATTSRITGLSPGDYTVTVTSSCFVAVDQFNICTCEGCYINGGPGTVQYYSFPTCIESRNLYFSIDAKMTEATSKDSYDGALELPDIFNNQSIIFSWAGPDSYTSSDKDIYGLKVGKYILTIDFGCSALLSYHTFYVTSRETCSGLDFDLVITDCYKDQELKATLEVENFKNLSGDALVIFKSPNSIYSDSYLLSQNRIFQASVFGLYHVTVIDLETGCEKDKSIYVAKPSSHPFQAKTHAGLTGRACPKYHRDNDFTPGWVKLIISGGVQPFHLKWHDGYEETYYYDNAFVDDAVHTQQRRFEAKKIDNIKWSVTITDACGNVKDLKGEMKCVSGIDENGNGIPCKIDEAWAKKGSNKIAGLVSNGDPDFCFDKCGDAFEKYCAKIVAETNTTSKNYEVGWPDGKRESLNSDNDQREWEVPYKGIFPVSIKGPDGCAEIFYFDYLVDCNKKHVFDYLGDGNTDPSCPKITEQPKIDGQNGSDFIVTFDMINVGKIGIKADFLVIPRGGSSEILHEGTLEVFDGPNTLSFPISAINSNPEITEFICIIKVRVNGKCAKDLEFTFNADGTISKCPEMQVFFADNEGTVDIFSSQDIDNCKLKIGSLNTVNINLKKNETVSHEFTNTAQGKISVTLDFPSSANCPKITQSYDNLSACNQNTAFVTPPFPTDELTLSISSSIKMTFNLIFKKKKGSKVSVPNSNNLVIEGSKTFTFDVSKLNLGEYEVEVDYISPNCPNIPAGSFTKTATGCKVNVSEHNYDSFKQKAFIHYIKEEGLEIKGIYEITKVGSNDKIISDKFTLPKNLKFGTYTIDVNKSLDKGTYKIYFSPYQEFGDCDVNLPFLIAGLKDDDPPSSSITCKDLVYDIDFDPSIDQYIYLTRPQGNSEEIIGSSFEAEAGKPVLDNYSALVGDIPNVKGIEIDQDKNHYITNIDENGVLVISKYKVTSAKTWSIPVHNKTYFSQHLSADGNLKVVVFDQSVNQFQLITVSSSGTSKIDNLNIPLVSYNQLKAVENGVVSARYEANGLSVKFFNNDGTVKETLFDKKLKIKDIENVSNSEFVIGGDFKGELNINGKKFNSEGFNNICLIKLNTDLGFTKILSENNYRDEFLSNISDARNGTVAIAGNFISNPNISVPDSCIFIKVLPWDVECTVFTSTLTSHRTPCQLTWNAPPAGYTTELQWNENGIWIEVSSIGLVAPGYTSPFTVLKDGTYRLIHKKEGCPDVVSNTVTTTCHGICVCPAPVLNYDNQACQLTWSTVECPGYAARLQRQNANGGWDDIALTAASPYTVTAAGIYRVMLSKPGCSQVFSNVVTTSACTPTTNPCTCTNASQLTLNTAACSLSWTTTSCNGYISTLQRFVAGAWTTINSTSPYAIPPNNNGQYRVLTSKPGCGDLVSNVVSASCSCSSPASITVFNSTYGLGQNVNLQKSQTYMHNVTSGHPNVCDDQFIELRFDANVVNSNWSISGTVGILPATVINGYYTFTVILPDPPSSGYGDVWLQSPCGDFYTLRLVYDCAPECVYTSCQSFAIVDDCINLSLIDFDNTSHSVNGSWFLTNGCFNQNALQLALNIKNKIIDIYPYCNNNDLEVFFTKEDGVGVYLVIQNSPIDIVSINYNSINSQDISYCPPLNCTCPSLDVSIDGETIHSCGNLIINVSNGAAPYTYVFTGTGSNGTQINQSGNSNIIILSSLAQNESITLNILVTDANGCTHSESLVYSRCNNTCVMGPLGKLECICGNLSVIVSPNGCIIASTNHNCYGNSNPPDPFYLYDSQGNELGNFNTPNQISQFIASVGNGTYYLQMLCACGFTNSSQFTINCPNYSNGGGTSQKLTNTVDNNSDLIRFYPNPFSKGINMEFTAPESDVMKMEVYNQVGIQVFTKTIDLMEGINLRYIDEFENMPSGVYTVKMRGTQSEHNTRVIKIE